MLWYLRARGSCFQPQAHHGDKRTDLKTQIPVFGECHGTGAMPFTQPTQDLDRGMWGKKHPSLPHFPTSDFSLVLEIS